MNIKDKKLIAIFMGAVIKDKFIEFPNGNKFFIKSIHTTHNLKYDTSWNDLMLVMEQCTCIVNKDNHLIYSYNRIIISLLNGNIKETYKAIVKFIKAYNNDIQANIINFIMK